MEGTSADICRRISWIELDGTIAIGQRALRFVLRQIDRAAAAVSSRSLRIDFEDTIVVLEGAIERTLVRKGCAAGQIDFGGIGIEGQRTLDIHQCTIGFTPLD